MLKQLYIFLFSMALFTASAQKMEADGFILSISDVKSEKYKTEFFGRVQNITEHTGTYRIQKGGRQIATQKFTLMNMDGSPTLNFRTAQDTGNTLSYQPETKTFDFAGENHKARNTSNTENLILSGLLVYAKYLENNGE
ncbi:MAG: hypothetical protein K0M63_05745 [Weeksellaceae bacterium]|nr:hypothetical protein [Weeksellaceae bacterium]